MHLAKRPEGRRWRIGVGPKIIAGEVDVLPSYVPQVMTVLAAIHEPTAIMKEAGAEIVRHVGEGESDYAHQSDAANIWRFMIDAMRRDS